MKIIKTSNYKKSQNLFSGEEGSAYDLEQKRRGLQDYQNKNVVTEEKPGENIIKKEWQKAGKRTYVMMIGKYKISLRPERTMTRDTYGKNYAVFIDEASPGGNNVWKSVKVINDVGSITQAKKIAEQWLMNNGLL